MEPSVVIERDLRLAKMIGLSATPSFALGVLDKDGQLSIKKVLVGAHPLSEFEAAISNIEPELLRKN